MEEKVLLISPTCPTCDALKKYLDSKGFLGNLRVLDVSTSEGLDFAKRLGIDGVPDCAVIESDGSQTTVRICSPEEWKRMLEGK